MRARLRLHWRPGNVHRKLSVIRPSLPLSQALAGEGLLLPISAILDPKIFAENAMNAMLPVAIETATSIPAVVIDTAIPITLRAALETAADLASNEKAPATRKAYASDFRIFQRWCVEHGLVALPADPAAVAGFIADEASRGVKASTLGRRIAAIKYRHKMAGEVSPTDDEGVKAVVRGARRTLGVAPRKLTAATAEKTIGMSTLTRGGLAGKRDRAMLLLGFAMAARRSELVALDVADIEECPEGLRVRIRKSKTDQEGVGVTIAVCRGSIACPVAAVLEWLAISGISGGPIFRSVRKGGKVTDLRLSAKSVCQIVKKHAGKLGLNAADFGAHSLRAGFLTSAAARGASIFKMMDVSRHKSVDTLRGYVRDANAFRDHAGAGLL
jgi:site-specific recombinase XerD